MSTTPAVCTYDNPDTMAREVWRDGRLLSKYDASLLLRKLRSFEAQPIPAEYFSMYANVGEWSPGQLVGDADAMIKAREANK